MGNSNKTGVWSNVKTFAGKTLKSFSKFLKVAGGITLGVGGAFTAVEVVKDVDPFNLCHKVRMPENLSPSVSTDSVSDIGPEL